MAESVSSEEMLQSAIRGFQVDSLQVTVHRSRRDMGRHVAALAAEAIADAIARQGRAVVFFASAPSQQETLEELTARADVDWPRITGLHIDEYVGARAEDAHSFRRFLLDRLVTRVPLGAFHGIQGEAPDPEAECLRYAGLLAATHPDLALLGIGENGHLAFNDPPVADFDDPRAVKVVELDDVCRHQQVHDGMFPSLGLVPLLAITVTLPPILRTPRLLLSVPGATKAEAVRRTLRDPISTDCPSTALRRRPGAHLILDEDAAARIDA